MTTSVVGHSYHMSKQFFPGVATTGHLSPPDWGSWRVLTTPNPCSGLLSHYISKVKYLASSSLMKHQAVVLTQGYNGILIPQKAYFVAENVVYVLDVPRLPERGNEASYPLILYRNPVIFTVIESMNDCQFAFTTHEMASFLYCLDESTIGIRMLHLDGCFIILDRYILAMAFVYLVRIGLSSEEFTIAYICAAALIAHKMEEDLYPGVGLMDLFMSSLPIGTTTATRYFLQAKVLEKQREILIKLNFRCWVDQETCIQIMETSAFHPLWRRRRLSFHSGAVTSSYFQWKLHCVEKAIGFANLSANTSFNVQGSSCCVFCLGNPRYSSNLNERFADNTGSQLHCTSEICSALLLSSMTLFEDYVNNAEDAERRLHHNYLESYRTLCALGGIEDSEPLEYRQALLRECAIEEILIRAKRFQEVFRLIVNTG